MKTFVLFSKQNLKAIILSLVIATINLYGNSQVTSTTNGLVFENPVHIYGTALQPGSQYRFADIANNTDAVVTLDSLVNGAQLQNIDDNGNGVGYKPAFQPRIQSGGAAGTSYAVFTIQFYIKNTTTPKVLQTVNATALDLDGNGSLKEFARINVGTGGTSNYLMATPDISVSQLMPGDFLGQNILGLERSGIDTSSLANMFTATNTNISAFTIKYGAISTSSSSTVRQYSLYLKGFNYPNAPLPVKLASFTATLNNNKADLKWTTASEINTSHFVVERSMNGVDFAEAGMVFAYGNATDKTDYSFSDNLSAIQSDVVYYRLRSVDNDSKSQYSETKMIRLSKQANAILSLIAYPNPVSTELRITIPANWQTKAVVYEIYAINGKLVSKKQTASSSQTETINTTSLNPGMYIVKAVCGNEAAQQKIIKQ
jgi:hypothetical protein